MGPSSAYRIRPAAILDVTGEDRTAFLQGQLTQDVRLATPGTALPAAGLTPKGKLLFTSRLLGLPDRLRLVLPAAARERVLAHLTKYALFQKVGLEDRSEDFVRFGIVGSWVPASASPDILRLPAEGEFASELLVPSALAAETSRLLGQAGAAELDEHAAEVLRVEAGRFRFGRDADENNLPDEVGLADAISTTKGCYVGQEIVARLRTYGRVNRRLVGFRFPEGPLSEGAILKRPGDAGPGKAETGRVTSSVVSPRYGPIGLGWAFRDVDFGDRLVAASDPARGAIATPLPFA
jgi:folate-binding protein YgfZ